jgi:hypothetical protein
MFTRVQSEYFIQNIPPMVVTVYYKQAAAENGAHPDSKNIAGSAGR